MPGWRNLAATIVGIIKGSAVYNRKFSMRFTGVALDADQEIGGASAHEKFEICREVAVLVEVFCDSGALILLNVRAVRLEVLRILVQYALILYVPVQEQLSFLRFFVAGIGCSAIFAGGCNFGCRLYA